MATHCNACGHDSEPFAEFEPGRGVVRKCGHPGCGEPLDLAPARPVPAPSPSAPAGGAAPPAGGAAPSPVAAQPRTAAALLVEVRARRAIVTAELERMASLTDELSLLDRLLAVLDSAHV